MKFRFEECEEMLGVMYKLTFTLPNSNFERYGDIVGDIISRMDIRMKHMSDIEFKVYLDFFDMFENFLIVVKCRELNFYNVSDILRDFYYVYGDCVLEFIDDTNNIEELKMEMSKIKQKIKDNRMEITYDELAKEIDREYLNMTEEEMLEVDEMLWM